MSPTKPHRSGSAVAYIADAGQSEYVIQRDAKALGISQVFWLSQRNSRLGWIGERQRPAMPAPSVARTAWQAAQPIFLPGLVSTALPIHQQHITQAYALMAAVLDGEECEELLQQSPYAERLAPQFELLGSSYDEGDPQEIVKIEFDALQGEEITAENLWVKLSWLSYEDEDASLRFRFSFGMENYEDVAADPQRQHYAAALTEALFPESAIISANPRVMNYLRELLEVPKLVYVERIVYFNAPEGGAQFHHDVERGHLGVVFAQVSGRSAWLALSTEQLLDEIQGFLTEPQAEDHLRTNIPQAKDRAKLLAMADNRQTLEKYLNQRDNDPLEQLINRTPAFARRLVEHGHAYILRPGDVILLPQHDADHCAWHAVYCLDDEPGEALSFAIRHA